MSLNVIQTKWKAILPMNRVLRLSKTVEDIFFIFLEYQDEHDMLKRKQMLWNNEGQWLMNDKGEFVETDSEDQENIAKEKFENFKTHL